MPQSDDRLQRICHVCSAHDADDPRVFHRACRTLVDLGYEVHLVARTVETAVHQRQGVWIHPVPPMRGRMQRMLSARRVAEIAAGTGADLYHVHEPELLSSVLSLSLGKPVVWDVHENYLDVLSQREWIPWLARPLVRGLWDLAERRMVGRCAAVIGATNGVADRYRGVHPFVTVVGNFPEALGVPFVQWEDRESAACVFTGTIGRNRGILEVISALRILKEKGVEAHLHLAGKFTDTRLSLQVFDTIKRLEVEALVSYHGVLSRDQALDVASRCAIGLVPHRFGGNNMNAWPVKMLEYMAMGLPLVYTDLPGHLELLDGVDGGRSAGAGSPAELAAAIEALLTDPGGRRRMGNSVREAVQQRLNWESESEKLREVYSRIMVRRDAVTGRPR
jgi:glycosyltransferase involved in cell wall biosynthesis